MNILLVEADRVLGKTYKNALENAGHNVIWKRTGQTALDTLDDQLPDVIVLELQLGLHGGIEFLYELRSQSDWLNLPVVIHTMNPRASEKVFNKAFTELGVDAILYKPQTTIAQLVRTLEHLVTQAA